MGAFPPPTERQARLIWTALTGLAIGVLAGLVAVLVWSVGRLLRLLEPVLWPIAVAGVLAYLLDPVVDWMQRRRVKRTRAIVGVFGLALFTAVAIIGSIVPPLVSEARQLVAVVPEYLARVEQRATDWINHPPPFIQKFLERRSGATRTSPSVAAAQEVLPAISTNAPVLTATATNSAALPEGGLDNQTLQTAADWLTGVAPRVAPWLLGQVGRVASWFGVLVGLALVPVYAFYFLLEKHGISSRWTNYLPVRDSRFKQELVFVLNAINDYLITFFRGQVLVAMCDGFLYGLGFLLVGLPYALLIGVMAVFLTMIPYLGAIVTVVTALIIALVQFGDWRHPLLVLAVFGCVQTFEGLVISPRIMGGRLRLHPVTIIMAVMVGTTLLGGLLGGILAIPLTAALRVLMSRYVWKREERGT
jgi:predicted PurR-regulated permease PerM